MNPLLRQSLGPWARGTKLWLRYLNDVQRGSIRPFRPAPEPEGLARARSEDTMQPALDSMTAQLADWTFERSVDSKAKLTVGGFVKFTKTLSDADVRAFARSSGDTSRLHLDSDYARSSRFGERIVHGTLVMGVVSAALARLPGLTIYISQDVSYLRPVPIGERVTSTCEIVEDLGDDRFRLTTVVTDEADDVVVDGEAVILIDDPVEPT